MRHVVALALALVASASACRKHRVVRRGDAGVPVPHVDGAVPSTVPVHGLAEIRFEVPKRTVAPDDVAIRGVLHAPDGKTITLGGFPIGNGYAVRFSPRVAGEHGFEIFADGGGGEHLVKKGSFAAVAGGGHGLVKVDAKHPHQLAFEDGAPFFMLGENRINVYDPRWNWNELGIEPYVARMAEFGMTTLRFFVFTDCESESTAGGRQLGCLEPEIGKFDRAVADDFDRIFAAAERNDVYVVMAPWAIGFTPGDETWKSWVDNPYSTARGGPASKPEEFFTSEAIRKTAAKKLRYVIDRWGWSTHLLAIDLINEPEWDGPIPETIWIPWAEAMAGVARAHDPYGHLITGGPVGLKWNVGEGDERPWYASPKNDLVQWHLYGKEYYDPQDLATEMTRRIEETWGFGKPVFCGEFAYGGEPKPLYDHTHVGIWSALMSGAGALAHTAPQFQVDSDEPMTDERAGHFRALSTFLRSLDGSRGLAPARDLGATPKGTRVWSLRDDDGRYRAMWLLAPREGYGNRLQGVTVTIPDLPAGTYLVEWYDDVTADRIGIGVTLQSKGGTTEIVAPPFTRHVAARLHPAPLPGAPSAAAPGAAAPSGPSH